MSGLKESTGSRAPGRDGDQDGTHGEEDNSRGTVGAARLYLYISTSSCKWSQLLWQLFTGRRKFNQFTTGTWKFPQKSIYRRLKKLKKPWPSCIDWSVRAVCFFFLWFSDNHTKAESPAVFLKESIRRDLSIVPLVAQTGSHLRRASRYRSWHFQTFDWLYVAAARLASARMCVKVAPVARVWCQSRSIWTNQLQRKTLEPFRTIPQGQESQIVSETQAP